MLRAWPLVLTMLIAAPALARDLKGTVSEILDGDTFALRIADDPQRSETVRLTAVDAPEASQLGYEPAKEALRRLLLDKTITVTDVRKTATGQVGRVVVDGVDPGLEQIKQGNAWYVRGEAMMLVLETQGYYLGAEAAARHTRAGLWVQPNPVAPWIARGRR